MTNEREDYSGEMLAAYALDATDDLEAPVSRRFLAEDPEARQELARYEDAIAASSPTTSPSSRRPTCGQGIAERVAATPRPVVAAVGRIAPAGWPWRPPRSSSFSVGTFAARQPRGGRAEPGRARWPPRSAIHGREPVRSSGPAGRGPGGATRRWAWLSRRSVARLRSRPGRCINSGRSTRRHRVVARRREARIGDRHVQRRLRTATPWR